MNAIKLYWETTFGVVNNNLIIGFDYYLMLQSCFELSDGSYCIRLDVFKIY